MLRFNLGAFLLALLWPHIISLFIMCQRKSQSLFYTDWVDRLTILLCRSQRRNGTILSDCMALKSSCDGHQRSVEIIVWSCVFCPLICQRYVAHMGQPCRWSCSDVTSWVKHTWNLFLIGLSLITKCKERYYCTLLISGFRFNALELNTKHIIWRSRVRD